MTEGRLYCVGCENTTDTRCKICGYSCCINCMVNEICTGPEICPSCWSENNTTGDKEKMIDFTQVALNEDTYLMTAQYDFGTIKMVDFIAEFDTQYIWDRENIINNEQQFYIDPVLHPEYSPFSFMVDEDGRKFLRITASPTPDALAEYAQGITKEGRDLIKARRKAGMLQPVTDEIKELYFYKQPFISGLITSRSYGWSQTYGYWEASLRLPNAAGGWPAWWLLPTLASWPPGVAMLPEIDIMEAISDILQGVYHSAVHTNTGTDENTGNTKMLHNQSTNSVGFGAELTENFHRYGVSKEPDFIVFFFDGTEVYRVPTPDDMHDPVHFLLNLAVGGWGGDVDINDYPAHLDVEWVRIYENSNPKQRKDVGDTVFILRDGRHVTKSILNIAAEYLIQVGETFPIIPSD